PRIATLGAGRGHFCGALDARRRLGDPSLPPGGLDPDEPIGLEFLAATIHSPPKAQRSARGRLRDSISQPAGDVE
ncbi:MAG: hypothetical protein VCC04_15075, partial [Myxococcota bacterium]